MAADSLRLAGDPRAEVSGRQITELFEVHGRMVYGLCCTLLRNRDDADDATQATFVSAYKSLLGGSDVREPAAWLATIARNECGARARARMREPLPLLDADLGHIQGPESELERKAVVEELQQAIAELPEKQREAVVLRDLYGLQYAEVGAVLGMSVASVESLLFRARRTLRVSLRPLATGALAVPVAVREGIAQAVPLFGGTGATGGGAVGGAAGLGLLAKLSGGPIVVKVAAGLAAVAAAGSAAAVGVEHSGSSSKPHGAALSPRSVKLALSSAGGGPVVAHAVDHTGREGKRVGFSSLPLGHGATSGFVALAHAAVPASSDDPHDSSVVGKSAVEGGNSDRAATHDAGADEGSSRSGAGASPHADSGSGSGSSAREDGSPESVPSGDSTENMLAATPSVETSDSGGGQSDGTVGGVGAATSGGSDDMPPSPDGADGGSIPGGSTP